MIDVKKTLTNLHNEFPEFDLDTLFKIVDSIVETSTITIPGNTRQPLEKPLWEWYNTYDIEYNVK